MTLRYDDIPPQLPFETPVTKPDGSSSEWFYEFLAKERGWFLDRAQDLNTRTFTLEETSGDASALVAAEATARADADSALASDILTLETSFGTFSAGGKVSFVATSTPTGADSAYEIHVTASDGVTDTASGIILVAKSDGTGYIMLRSGKVYIGNGTTGIPFVTFDAGTMTAIFQNVVITGNLIASGALLDLGATQTFPSNIIIQSSSGGTVSTPTLITGTNTASFTVAGNAYVDVIVQSTLQIVSSVGTAYTASLYVGVDGVYRFIKTATSNGSAELVQGDTIRRFRVTAGTHTISLGYTFIPGPIGSPVGDLQLNAGSQYDWAVTKDGRA